MSEVSIAEEKCQALLRNSSNEISFDKWLKESAEKSIGYVVCQGFEERSLRLLERLPPSLTKGSRRLVIIRYPQKNGTKRRNREYEEDFKKAATEKFAKRFKYILILEQSDWFKEITEYLRCEEIFVDITGMSNPLLFQFCEQAKLMGVSLNLGYTEAKDYWPKKENWQKIESKISESDFRLKIDSQEWLWGAGYNVSLLKGFEGFEAPATPNALLAFLTFKPSRLSSILGEFEYSYMHFFLGIPRLKSKAWRIGALSALNDPIHQKAETQRLSTFSYSETAKELVRILFQSDPKLALTYNIQIAPLGSKLQSLGCWVVATSIKSIGVVISSPEEYFPRAFSSGSGRSWVIKMDLSSLEKR